MSRSRHGRFGGGYNLGDIGGEEKHTQTVSELAPHQHELLLVNYGSGNDMVINIDGTRNARGADSIGTLNTGGGQPFNIMQPYIVHNKWKRIL
jgi:microcystin-dependent protein